MDPMLNVSVTVDNRIVEATAGSAPSFRRAIGRRPPINPLTNELNVIAIKTTIPNVIAELLFCVEAIAHIAPPAKMPPIAPLRIPSNASFIT